MTTGKEVSSETTRIQELAIIAKLGTVSRESHICRPILEQAGVIQVFQQKGGICTVH